MASAVPTYHVTLHHLAPGSVAAHAAPGCVCPGVEILSFLLRSESRVFGAGIAGICSL